MKSYIVITKTLILIAKINPQSPILNNENTIITVSSYDKDNDIYMGMPTVVNRNGVDKRIYVNLTEEETQKLQNSVDVIKEAIKNIEE